jgi:hypothetical protein
MVTSIGVLREVQVRVKAPSPLNVIQVLDTSKTARQRSPVACSTATELHLRQAAADERPPAISNTTVCCPSNTASRLVLA